MTETEALRIVIENLWYRVRHLEMIVIQQADNRDFNAALHGIRSSLYATGEYYGNTPNPGSFNDSVNQILQTAGDS